MITETGKTFHSLEIRDDDDPYAGTFAYPAYVERAARRALPAGAHGPAAAEPLANRSVQLLPGGAQPDRRVLPVERLLPADLCRGVAVQGVRTVADVRHGGEEPRDPGRRQRPDHAGVAVHRGGDRVAPAAAGCQRGQVPAGAADRAAAAGPHRGLGVPVPAGFR